MKLIIVRHAIALPRESWTGAPDAQRPLTDAGREQARRVGEALRRLKLSPGLILTSPWVRAVQTAEQIAVAFDGKLPVREAPALRGDSTPREASSALKAVADEQQVIAVGHEPHLSEWLAELISADGSARCLLKKGSVACVELERVPPEPGSGTLRWLMTPKQLALLAK